MINSDLIVLEWDDAIRSEVLRSRTMGNMSSREFNDQLLSPEYADLSAADMFLNQVRSEGLRKCNMDMDLENRYEIFNGMPVYYGGDLYDSEDTEVRSCCSGRNGFQDFHAQPSRRRRNAESRYCRYGLYV